MSRSTRHYVNEHLARVDSERRHAPVTDDDIRSLVASYSSPDPVVRARALRQSCPCHVPWDVYEQLRPYALKLRRDRDTSVRAVAVHLEEDARSLRGMEAAVRRWEDEDERIADIRHERTRRRRR